MAQHDYASLVIILSIVMPISLMSNIGLPALSVKLLTDQASASPEKHQKLVGLFSLKLIATIIAAACLLTIHGWQFNISPIQLPLVGIYTIALLLNQLILDNFMPSLELVKPAFWLRLGASVLKMSAGVYLLIWFDYSLESVLGVLAVLEFLLLSACLIFINVRFSISQAWQLIEEYWIDLKGLSISSGVEFLISKSFIIIVLAFVLGDSNLAPLAFVMNISLLTLSGFSLISRLEVMFINLYRKKDKNFDVLNTYVKVWQVQLILYSVIIFPIFSDISLIFFGGKYQEYFDSLNLIILIGILAQFSYILSPVVHSAGTLNVFLYSSSFAATLFIIIFPVLIIFQEKLLPYSVLLAFIGKTIFLSFRYRGIVGSLNFFWLKGRLLYFVLLAEFFAFSSCFYTDILYSKLSYFIGVVLLIAGACGTNEFASVCRKLLTGAGRD